METNLTVPLLFQFFSQMIIPLVIFILVGYLLSRILKRNDIADVLWGLGFIDLAVHFVTGASPSTFRAKIVFTFTLIWGLRLALYLGNRTFQKSEDHRYAQWRIEWGRKEPLRAFFQVFVLQGLLMGVIAVPVAWTLRTPGPDLSPLDFLGSILFLIGFIFESVADSQLALFKKDPENKGKRLVTGVWAYSRHPNYLGEVLIWWGIFFISTNVPYGIFGIVSPLLITFLLLKVSGVPLLEKHLKEKAQAPVLLPFRMKALVPFFVILITLVSLDLFWLGYLMKDFYRLQVHAEWKAPLWAVLGVYLPLSFGIQHFSVQVSQNRADALFKGALLGLVIYSVYEFTNLALLDHWPTEMALVDIIWGTFLCAVASSSGYLASEKKRAMQNSIPAQL